MAQISVPVCSLIMLIVMGLFIDQAAAGSYNCCTKYSTGQVPINKVKGYYIQENKGPCNIKAVVLRTLRNKWVCADPNQAWVPVIVMKLGVKVAKLRGQ
ncbi:C-C motif chemokine 20-like [Clupea harengus]|uniref:C-C motif chemokine 20-like n=1 Tax=Clupea harengus TaxID=7950 RepID=A0A6P8ETP0_CLUHA|nr:C-C motif chemokine 20-like [Clupea harengus]